MRTPTLRWSTAALASVLLLGNAAAQVRGEIVQSGTVFTGVIQGNRSFNFPIALAGFAEEGRLRAVEVTIQVRMSGSYTIQPTPVSPNGIVEAHSVTVFSLDNTTLGMSAIDFAPLPWVFPVNFPLSVLWALDDEDRRVLTDDTILRSFQSRQPITMNAAIDIDTLISPKGWASEVAGVFATWEVKYVYDSGPGRLLRFLRAIVGPFLAP